jgi:hypothetical protein
MPPRFSRLALTHLLELPLGEPTSFEQFAERMIEDSGMVLPIENQDIARRILRSIIERTLINPLVDFDILQTEFEPHTRCGMELRELSSFRISPFGRGLLEAINGATKQEQP